MTIEEARKIAATCSTAHGDRYYCAEQLRKMLQDDFPEFNWSTDDHGNIVVTSASS